MEAFGVSGVADLAAVEDQLVREEGPFGLGDEFHEVLFDFDGIGVFGEVEAEGEAGDVGIDDDADVLVEGVAEDDVGGFSADAAELGEFVHGVGDLAVMFFDDVGGGGGEGGGFGRGRSGCIECVFRYGLGGLWRGLRGWGIF